MIRHMLGLGAASLAIAIAPPSPPQAEREQSPPRQEDDSCLAALDSMLAVFEHDYPGYHTRVVGQEAPYRALSDSVRAVAATPAADADFNVCIPALKRVTRYYRDAHLIVWQGSRPAPAPAASGTGTGHAATSTAAASAASTAPSTPPDDPDRPTIRRYDPRTLAIRIPDLDMRYQRAVDSLVAEHRSELTAAQTLVIDLRGNGGGCTCTYDALMPFVATGPVRGDGLEVWASPANVAWLRSLVADPATPDTLRADLRRVLPRLEAAPNTFVSWSGRRQDYVPPRVPPRPAAVAVLVDSVCASSCEDFVRAAQQSRKATVFSATNTAGAGDYGNVRSVPLPGWRRLRVATSRSRRLRAGTSASTDFVGVAPDVRLPRDSAVGDAAIAFAVRHHRRRAAR